MHLSNTIIVLNGREFQGKSANSQQLGYVAQCVIYALTV